MFYFEYSGVEDLMEELSKYRVVPLKQLYMYWGMILGLSLLCIAFLGFIFISNSRFHLKKKGYHTYIDLYKEIRVLNRKYKKIPIIVFKDDKYYKGNYRYTANGRLVINANEEIDISKDFTGSKTSQKEEKIEDIEEKEEGDIEG